MNRSRQGPLDPFEDDEGIDVNSFFLPGGILDPDDSSAANDLSLGRESSPLLSDNLQPFHPPSSTEQSRIIAPLMPTQTDGGYPLAKTAVPSNPWFSTEQIISQEDQHKGESQNWSSSDPCTATGTSSPQNARPPPGFHAKHSPVPSPTDWSPSQSTRNDLEHPRNKTTNPAQTASGTSTITTSSAAPLLQLTTAKEQHHTTNASVGKIRKRVKHHEKSVAEATTSCVNEDATAHNVSKPVLPSRSHDPKTPQQAVVPRETKKAEKQKNRSRKKPTGAETAKKAANGRTNGSSDQLKTTQSAMPTKDTSCKPCSSSFSHERQAFANSWITDPAVQVFQWIMELYHAVLLPTWRSSYLLIRSALDFVATVFRIVVLASIEITTLAVDEVKSLHISRTNIRHIRKTPPSIAIAYISLYILPTLCDILMLHFDFPPFLPDAISSLALFYLSYPCFEDTVSSRHSKLASRRSSTRHHGPVPLDHRLSRDTLRCFRIVYIPLHFVCAAQRCATPHSNILMTQSALRLILAYGLTIAKRGICLSPFCWFSGATQLLVAAYMPRGYVCDAAIATIGLASVRTVRTMREDNDNK